MIRVRLPQGTDVSAPTLGMGWFVEFTDDVAAYDFIWLVLEAAGNTVTRESLDIGYKKPRKNRRAIDDEMANREAGER